MQVVYYRKGNIENTGEVSPVDRKCILEEFHYKAMKEMLNTEKEHVLYGITIYDNEDNIVKQLLFSQTPLSNEELEEYIRKYKNAYFSVVHKGSRQACKTILERRKKRVVKNIHLKDANKYVNQFHRHHKGTVGCKFSIGLYEGNNLIGVAICGRPVSRFLDNGDVCEINRLCTRGGKNACSMLYGACCRIAKEMGYTKIITYILQSESGISLKASGFTCKGVAGGTHWTGARNKGQDIPAELKTRWERDL